MARCTACHGDGWYADHGDACYEAGHHVDGETCPMQRECHSCEGTGKR